MTRRGYQLGMELAILGDVMGLAPRCHVMRWSAVHPSSSADPGQFTLNGASAPCVDGRIYVAHQRRERRLPPFFRRMGRLFDPIESLGRVESDGVGRTRDRLVVRQGG